MTQYQYQRLPRGHGNIRLLRLLPHDDEAAPVECRLINYSIQNHRRTSHLYEALSYVWGTIENKPLILVDGAILDVTQNLHAALRRLRDPQLERILWVDAICINQDDLDERAEQVQYMTKIYRCASRVLVWVGPEANGSERAMNAISARAQHNVREVSDEPEAIVATNNFWDDDTDGFFDTDSSVSQEDDDSIAILALLERPWFRRVWILQEIAAARAISILCGPSEITGQCFVLGLETVDFSNQEFEHVQRHISSAVFLMNGAGFHMRSTCNLEPPSRLDISPLPNLIDMFHAHDATDRRDKVFALLGMSCAIPDTAGLLPNYRIEWQELFRRLIAYSLGPGVTATIETWNVEDFALIRSRACILGHVVRVSSSSRGGQKVDMDCNHFCYVSEKVPAHQITWDPQFSLHTTAKRIHEDDLLCLLQGAQVPMIIRPCLGYFSIIAVATPPPQYMQRVDEEGDCEWLPDNLSWSDFLKLATSFPQDMLFSWSWDKAAQSVNDSTAASVEARPTISDYTGGIEDLSNFARTLEGIWDEAYLESVMPELRSRLARYEHPVIREQLRMLRFSRSSIRLKVLFIQVLRHRQHIFVHDEQNFQFRYRYILQFSLVEIRSMLEADSDLARAFLDTAKERSERALTPYYLPMFLALFHDHISMDAIVRALLELLASREYLGYKVLEKTIEHEGENSKWLCELFSHLFNGGSRESYIIFWILRVAAAGLPSFFDTHADDIRLILKTTNVCQYCLENSDSRHLLDYLYKRFPNELLPWLNLKRLLCTDPKDDANTLKETLQQGPGQHLPNGFGNSLLWLASSQNLPKIANFLLSTGEVDLRATRYNVLETLDETIYMHHTACCRVLLMHGAFTRDDLEVRVKKIPTAQRGSNLWKIRAMLEEQMT